MKKLGIIFTVCLFLTSLIIGVAVPGGIFQAPSALAQELDASHKISSLLKLQLEAKLRAVEAGGVGAALEDSLQAGRVDILRSSGIRLDDIDRQRIFIHFYQEPTHSQIEELEAMGITPYLDSWIPPVGAHPTGFIIADMPIDRLGDLASKEYVISLDTAERTLEPENDLATQKTNADDVWGLGYDGTGVTIAVLDTGLDTTHPDIPTPVVGKDYSNYPTLSSDIANTYTGHGTHVTGSALGRGTQSSGVYKGSAPDADLIFLKISGGSLAWYDAAIKAIHDAVDLYGADIITLSFGQWFDHHDGTSEIAQAVDYAVSQGALFFKSAGNRANYDQHYSGTVAAFSSTDYIQINVTGAGATDTILWFNLVWYDGLGTNNVLNGQFYDSGHNSLSTINDTQSESTRGTEARLCYYGPSQGSHYAVSSGTYYIKITNNSAVSQDFHIYVWVAGAGSVTFQNPDPDYTLTSPADADSAIAVGAYTTRKYWWDYKNGPSPTGWSYTSGETVDQICSFSSRGPRVDTGAPPKPNIVAPGSAIISCRDDDILPLPPSGEPASTYAPFVDNDGPNEYSATKNDGTGPADYYVMSGTSMASPHAAGIAALILDKNPGLTPAQVKDALESTATDKGASGWDTIYGWGLIDAQATIQAVINPPTVTTNAATLVEETTATINGVVSDDGGEACEYRFQYDTESGAPYAYHTSWKGSKTTGQSFSKSISSLSKGTKYYFRAQARNSAGTGSGYELTFLTKPDEPTGFSATTSGTTQIDLSWTKGDGAQQTRIQRKQGSYPTDRNDGTQVYFDTGTSTPDTGLTPGTTYYYRAWSYASGSEQWSDDCAQDSATTTSGITLPTVTTNAATLVEETMAALNGTVSDDGGEACQYRFQYDTDSGEPYAYNTTWTGNRTSGQSFSESITSLSKGTKYYFRAQARNSAGTGSGSEQSFLTKPDAPTSFNASTVNSTQINLSWAKGDGAQQTKIQRKQGSYPTDRDDGTQVYFETGTSTPDTGLNASTTYYYRAWSYVSGSEQWSDNYAEDSATTTSGITAPTVTTNAATLVEETTATLNGTVSDDGGEACQYRFEYDTDSGAPYAYNTTWTGSKTTGQSFSEPISSLNKGTKYYFRAQARNSAGTGSGSELTFLTKPDAPTSFNASTVNSTQINLSWTNGAGAQQTKIQRKQGSYPTDRDDGTQVYFETGNSTPDTGLNASTTYYYRAWSYVSGSEQWSDEYAEDSATTTSGITLPTVTTNAATLVEETTATLNGTVSDDGGEACQYRFEYDTDSGAPYAYNTTWTESKPTGQSFSESITSLNKGTKYYFRAQARNSAGTSSGSEQSFLTKPDAPTSFNASTVNSTQINLSWTNGAGAQQTKIQRKQGSYPTDRDDGTQVYFETGNSTPDTGLNASTTYYYRAWSYVSGSEQWSDSYTQDWATTNSIANNPPNTPSNPSPANDATSVYVNADLSWTGGDPDAGDNVTYDVYFGTNSTPPQVSNNQTETTYDPGTLSYNTTYYWKVVATDNHSASTTGPLWDFTTCLPSLMEGDATLDRHVTMVDALFIAQHRAKLITLNADQLICSDTTDDGVVDMIDALHIAQWRVDSDGTGGVLFKPLWESPADDDMLPPEK